MKTKQTFGHVLLLELVLVDLLLVAVVLLDFGSGHGAGLALHLLDVSNHVKRNLWQIVVLSCQDLLKGLNGVLERETKINTCGKQNYKQKRKKMTLMLTMRPS